MKLSLTAEADAINVLGLNMRSYHRGYRWH